MKTRKTVIYSLILVLGFGVTWGASTAQAVVRLKTLCTLKGQQEVKLIGSGLVLGLNGTGDGAGNSVTVQSMATALRHLNTDISAEALRNADNVAYVILEATIPATGLKKGQKVDVFVSSILGAESLKSGRLMISPMEDADLESLSLYGLASGAVRIEDPDAPTSGVITDGLTLMRDVEPELAINGSVTFNIREPFISFGAARKIVDAIHQDFRTEALEFSSENEQSVASDWIKFDNRSVTVQIPSLYQREIPLFISELENVAVDSPNSKAEVRVNPRTNKIIISGGVEISPTIVSLGDLRLEIGQPGNGRDSFVDLDRPNPEDKLPQLMDLKSILNNLQVPPEDVVNIIRMLNDMGKLHAVYIEE